MTDPAYTKLYHALNAIRDTPLIVHLISHISSQKLEFMLQYNITSHKYDYSLRINDGEVEEHYGTHGMTIESFMSEVQEGEIVHLIEIIDPVTRKVTVLHSLRTRVRHRPIQRPQRRQ